MQTKTHLERSDNLKFVYVRKIYSLLGQLSKCCKYLGSIQEKATFDPQ